MTEEKKEKDIVGNLFYSVLAAVWGIALFLSMGKAEMEKRKQEEYPFISPRDPWMQGTYKNAEYEFYRNGINGNTIIIRKDGKIFRYDDFKENDPNEEAGVGFDRYKGNKKECVERNIGYIDSAIIKQNDKIEVFENSIGVKDEYDVLFEAATKEVQEAGKAIGIEISNRNTETHKTKISELEKIIKE